MHIILNHLRKHGCLLSARKYHFLTMLVTHITELNSSLMASALRNQKFKKIWQLYNIGHINFSLSLVLIRTLVSYVLGLMLWRSSAI